MRQYIGRFIALVCLLLAVSVVPAGAQDCDSIVVDEAGVFSGTDAVAQAAASLSQRIGADVRVRTWQSLGPHAALPPFIQQIRKSCGSWQNSPNNDIRSNLVVIALSLNPKRVGIIAGHDYAATADAHHLRIEQDLMGPRFRNRDFAGGFVAGMDEFGRVAYAALHPPVYNPPSYRSPDVTERPVPVQPIVVHEQPTDFSGLWSVMRWGLVVVVLGGGIFLVFRIFRERERRRAAQQGATSAKAKAAQLIIEIPGLLESLAARLALLRQKVDESDLTPVQRVLEKAKRETDDATLAYSDFGNSTSDPALSGLSVAEYERIEEQYAGIYKTLAACRSSVNDSEKAFDELDRIVTEAPVKVAGLTQCFTGASLRIEAVTRSGFRTDTLVREFKTVFVSLSSGAQDALKARQYNEAMKLAEQAEKAAKRAAEEAERLPVIAADIQARLTKLTDSITATRERIVVAKDVFDSITSEFAENSWSSVRGNGTEATNRVNLAQETLDKAIVAGATGTQDFAGAQQLLDVGEKAVDRAVSIIRSIMELATSLREAKAHAQRDVDAAQADVDKSNAYNTQVDNDVNDSVWPKLKIAEKHLSQARAELTQAKPDYFEVIKLAKKAHDLADETLQQARTEHEAAERLRQKAAVALRDAKSRVSKAKEYIDDHRSDVRRSAKDKRDDAIKLLAEAEAATNLAQQVSLAEQAESKAKDAYNKAKSDFEQAEDDRTPHYSPTVIVNSPTYGDSGYHSSPSASSNESSWGTNWSSGSSSSGSSGGGDSIFSSFDSGGSSGGGDSSW